MTRRLHWDRDGHDWPLREHSRFVQAGGIRWHVQQMGQGPSLLLLHGTGSATHSWRGLMPLLAAHCQVTSMDLPGHGFTGLPPADMMSIAGMARVVRALVDELGIVPAGLVGHSAGAAVAVRMALDGLAAPQAVVSLNGALLPLGGVPGRVFSPMARLMAANPVVARLFAWSASMDRAAVLRLLDSTGSTLDARGNDLYGRLVRNTGHVAGALVMMSQWDLPTLRRDLPRLATPLHLVVGDRDRTVPPVQANEVQALLPRAELSVLPGLGHLAHEQKPADVAALVLRHPWQPAAVSPGLARGTAAGADGHCASVPSQAH